MNSSDLDARARDARDWACAQLKLPEAGFAPASADASFRRYFRITAAERSWVLMDAPPEKEDCGPFIKVAALMQAAGLNVPQIHAQDLARGYLLLSDLGRETWLKVINEGNADEMFPAAMAALIRWQKASREDVLPPYDEALLRRELRLFPDWYVAKHLQRSFTPGQQALWQEVEDLLVRAALVQPRVFVHRDYMPRNLMLSTPSPGILDFQDAVHGPLTYDLVSLYRDAFLSWPEPRVKLWVRQYWEQAQRAHLPVGRSFAEFFADFDLMGAQRHLKVVGIFARINYRDGKPHYLADVPRFIRYLRECGTRHASLKPLLQLMDELGMQA